MTMARCRRNAGGAEVEIGDRRPGAWPPSAADVCFARLPRETGPNIAALFRRGNRDREK